MSAFDELLRHNEGYAASFASGGLQAPPARRLAVVTCMDARILPLRALGLGIGDAHVIRNAGGRVSDDALRSLLVSTHALGVRAIAVVHHTECGVAGMTEAEFRQLLLDATGHEPGDIRLLAITDPDQALRDDVDRVAGSPLFPAGTEVVGLRYDVRSGRTTVVVPPVVVGGAAGC